MSRLEEGLKTSRKRSVRRRVDLIPKSSLNISNQSSGINSIEDEALVTYENGVPSYNGQIHQRFLDISSPEMFDFTSAPCIRIPFVNLEEIHALDAQSVESVLIGRSVLSQYCPRQ